MTPLPTPTKTPTPGPTKIPTSTPTETPTETYQPEILGESAIVASPSSTPNKALNNIEANKLPVLALVLIGFGILTIGVSSFLMLKIRYNNLHEAKITPPT